MEPLGTYTFYCSVSSHAGAGMGFVAGAYEALRLAQVVGASEAILKERSPSCGSSFIYNGSFTGTKEQGMGVTAALLRRHSIQVSSKETAKIEGAV